MIKAIKELQVLLSSFVHSDAQAHVTCDNRTLNLHSPTIYDIDIYISLFGFIKVFGEKFIITQNY